MLPISRRDLLRSVSCGFGYLALTGLAQEQASAEAASGFSSPLMTKPAHFPARARRVIFLFMQGGPSHIDTFDPKPELAKMSEDSGGNDRMYASPFKFAAHGDSGVQISELFPELSRHADDLCVLNGMYTDNPAHPQATIMLHTGSINFVRPSLGAWVVYGLGTENQDLPGFVTINPPANLGGAQNYGSAFLPAAYQATQVAAGKTPIANIRSPFLRNDQRRQLDLIQAMNQDLLERQQVNSELEGVIESFELAFRMQTSVPEMVDIQGESAAVKQRYGIGQKVTDNFGKQCLMARRLAESGVRFIEIAHRGWDQHRDLSKRLPANCRATDKPIAALLSDLKERGMLEDTLVIWGGEFGRQPVMQNGDGRGHNHRGYTMWMAGGGVQGGTTYGATDPTGLYAEENKVHTHDLHATILHLLGLDHERLTYRYSGRDFRLTDVYGNVVSDIVA